MNISLEKIVLTDVLKRKIEEYDNDKSAEDILFLILEEYKFTLDTIRLSSLTAELELIRKVRQLHQDIQSQESPT